MDQNSYKGFKDLNCWKEGRMLRQKIKEITASFPQEEKYMLTSQVIRASRSVTANIAEGYGRYTYADTKHFFIQSRGSITEILDHLTVAFDEGYIDENILKAIEEQCETVFKLVSGYISYLDKANTTAKNPNSKIPITNS